MNGLNGGNRGFNFLLLKGVFLKYPDLLALEKANAFASFLKKKIKMMFDFIVDGVCVLFERDQMNEKLNSFLC